MLPFKNRIVDDDGLPYSCMMNHGKNWAVLLSLVIICSAAIIALYRGGLAHLTAADDRTRVIVGAIGVVGVVMAAVLSMFGALLKNSIDSRAEQRLAIESEQNVRQASVAERRLKLEAAIRAVELFSESADEDVKRIRRIGALFTLSSLGQHDVSMVLAKALLTAGAIDPDTIARLTNNALLSDDYGAQHMAIDIVRDFPALATHASRIRFSGGNH
jgi:hypothetical protein